MKWYDSWNPNGGKVWFLCNVSRETLKNECKKGCIIIKTYHFYPLFTTNNLPKTYDTITPKIKVL